MHNNNAVNKVAIYLLVFFMETAMQSEDTPNLKVNGHVLIFLSISLKTVGLLPNCINLLLTSTQPFSLKMTERTEA